MTKSTTWIWTLQLILPAILTALILPACTDTENEEGPATDGDQGFVEDGDAENILDGDIEIDGDGLEADAEEEAIEPHMEMRNAYNIVWLSGSPYEMGYQQGEMLHDKIEDAMEFVAQDPILNMIATLAEGWGIIDLAMENSYPDLLEECQGLADATEDVGFSLELCLILNFGDVMLEQIPISFKNGPIDGPGCTSVIAAGKATADGRIYHARNLDWGSMDISIIHQYPVIFVRQPSAGIPHIYVGFPMNLSPYTGMNAEGLTATSHEADPVDDSEIDQMGRSHAQMMGELLKRAHSLEEARAIIEGEDHMSAEMIVMTDGTSKEGLIFEMTAKHQQSRSLVDDIVYTTNHFVHPDMADFDLPQDPEAVREGTATDSSLMRWWRLEQLVAPEVEDTYYGALDPENMTRVMRDRINPLTGMEPPYDEENIDNNAGIATNGPMHFVVFDPEKLLFWVAAGQIPIDKQPYECFSMEELLGYPDPEACEPARFE